MTARREWQEHWKPTAKIDAERRPCHFQVRLPPDLCQKVKEFQREHAITSRNQTLRKIIQSYFEFNNG
jgi:hypothetical protein